MLTSLYVNSNGKTVAVVDSCEAEPTLSKIICDIERFPYSADDLAEAVMSGFGDFPEYDPKKHDGYSFSELIQQFFEDNFCILFDYYSTERVLVIYDDSCELFVPSTVKECISRLKEEAVAIL